MEPAADRGAPGPAGDARSAASIANMTWEGKGLTTADTPMMKQYKRIKSSHQDMILMFRLGDFYEMFYDDATTASRVLDITLTARQSRGVEVPMCGVPHHAAGAYIARLVQAGHKVAICEQVEDPSQARGIVERDVVRVITPGTITDDTMLPQRDHNYLAAVTSLNGVYGLAYLDFSTGDFLATNVGGRHASRALVDELNRIRPAECLIPPVLDDGEAIRGLLQEEIGCLITPYGEWAFRREAAETALKDHFGVASLEAFGCDEAPATAGAAGAIVSYLEETQPQGLAHVASLRTYSTDSYMVLDRATARNLELTRSLREGKRRGTLLWVLDRTVTAMGGRLLKTWVQQPLTCRSRIEERLEAVAEFVHNSFLRSDVRQVLKGVQDIQRLSARIASGSANARDLAAFSNSLRALKPLDSLLAECGSRLLLDLSKELDPLEDVVALLTSALHPDPPGALREGGLIADGYSDEVDELRRLARGGKEWITQLQAQERGRTGIKSLKVGFNKVFGYYIEVTRANLHLVPDDYQRKQTLSNSERYFTPELKERENAILGAEDRLIELEYQLFAELRQRLACEMDRARRTAGVVSVVDALASLGEVALRNQYTKPEITEGKTISITGGRHPVVESFMDAGAYVPNDSFLDCEEHRVLLITGPNMAGKSTYMRQVALIVLMAQIGSFVPAQAARIGIVDRIFTRVGASDDLVSGQSTFMVEMTEVANILNHATDRSLVILDEIGRGTSTLDGLSIAWSVTEFINSPQIGAKTLFATHFHELTELEQSLDGVRNYSVAIREEGRNIVFLRKLVKGRSGRSYGIQVAKLAGLPGEVIDRAAAILAMLESREQAASTTGGTARSSESGDDGTPDGDRLTTSTASQLRAGRQEAAGLRGPKQLSLLPHLDQPVSAVLEALKAVPIMELTPLQALNLLHELQEKARKETRDS